MADDPRSSPSDRFNRLRSSPLSSSRRWFSLLTENRPGRSAFSDLRPLPAAPFGSVGSASRCHGIKLQTDDAPPGFEWFRRKRRGAARSPRPPGVRRLATGFGWKLGRPRSIFRCCRRRATDSRRQLPAGEGANRGDVLSPVRGVAFIARWSRDFFAGANHLHVARCGRRGIRSFRPERALSGLRGRFD